MTSFMGGFYQISEWIARFAVVNLLWLLGNLPIILIIINMTIVDTPGLLPISSLVLVILAPFLFFPSTAAMFASVRDWILNKENQSHWKSFWGYYKDNYKKSMILGLILTVAWVVVIVDIYYFSQENVVLMFAFGALSILLFVYTINLFSVMAHYEMKVSLMMKRAFLFTVGSPLLGVIIILSSIVILYVSVNGLQFLLLFFSGSLISFVSFSAFYKFYTKLTLATTE